MSKVFVINIGNTNTQYGLCINGKIENIQYIPTHTLSAEIIPPEVPVAIASVVPAKNLIFSDLDVFFVSWKNQTPVDFSSIDYKSMGADRIANAVALAKYANLPAMCIDCGTAITIEVVDSDFRLAGGIIAPGRKLWRKSLNNYTALLPYIENFDSQIPDSTLATTTETAILAGCDVGIIGMVRELIQKITEDLGGIQCQIFATGGDADIFTSNIENITHVGPDFTLRGIAAIYHKNADLLKK
jgi:type III pantothenate kinase